MLRLFRQDHAGTATAHLQIQHAGESYCVNLKRMRGARRYILRVRAATRDVVLTMPARGSLASARDFAERHAAWIGARLRRLPQPVPFAPGSVIPVRGVDHVVVHRSQSRGVIWIEPAPEGAGGAQLALCVAGEAAHLPRRILDYLKREARRDLETSVRHYAGLIGEKPRPVTVRDTTSRWGSCSASGALNFSWRLVMAPAFVLDYLAAHEVGHLVHMNHSDAFWSLVQRICPQTEKAEAWLKAHGAKLHRYGAVREADQPFA